MKKYLHALFLLLFVVFLSVLNLNAQNAASYNEKIEEHRRQYIEIFLNDSHAPITKKDIVFLDFFAPNPTYSVEATFKKKKNGSIFEMPTYSGITKPYVKYGTLSFQINGKKYRLAVYQSIKLQSNPEYRDYLFLPFKDLTNGETSYGGGRYLDLRMGEIKNNKIMLDFNKAYNPYCAYSDGYSCPIPPDENHLNIAILAGEKAFKKAH